MLRVVKSQGTQTAFSPSEKIWCGTGEAGVEGKEQSKSRLSLTLSGKGRKQLPSLPIGETNGRVWGDWNPAAQRSSHGVWCTDRPVVGPQELRGGIP